MGMNNANEIFSKNLKRLMMCNGYTQTTLAKEIGVSQGAVGNWVRGEKFPRIAVVDKLALLFDCPKSELLEGKADSDKIVLRHKHAKLIKYLDRLTDEGVDRALNYFEDLNPKYYYEDEDDV